MTREIQLTRGKVALVDDDDYEMLSRYKWYAQRGVHSGWMAARTETLDRKRNILMHREILGAPAGVLVDHANGNTLDNRRCNLRRCSNAENVRNGKLRSTNKTGFRGVSAYKSPRMKRVMFRSDITVGGRQIQLGLYELAISAALVYDAEARERFGSFARLNFPRPGERGHDGVLKEPF